MGGSVKGNFVVSDELTVTVPGLGLQPGSGHSCAVELRQALWAAQLFITQGSLVQ